jgi:probable HAF family extracellular repeat protein
MDLQISRMANLRPCFWRGAFVENTGTKRLFGAIVALVCWNTADLLGQSHWEVKQSGTTSSLNAVTFGNGLFVAVGDDGTILTSADGDVWTARSSGTTDRLPAIAFGNGRFVATRTNRGSPAITSLDGINWTPVSLTESTGAPASSGASDAITFGGGRFMAVGSVTLNSTEIMASPDGVSFQTVNYARYPAPFYLWEALKSVFFFRGQFYAGTGSGGFVSSSDGVSWKYAGWVSGNFIATDELSNVAILGFYQAFSIDAAHTFLRTEQPTDRSEIFPGNIRYSPQFTAMCYGAGGFVAVDTKGRTWTSERGEFWLPRGHYAKAEEGFRGIAFNGIGHFVAVGSAPASGSALIAVAQADPPRSAPPGYTVYGLKDLSNGVFDGEPRSISNSGIIGGSVTGVGEKSIGAILRDGVVTTYPDPIYGGDPTVVTSVNDNGSAALEVITGWRGIFQNTLGVILPENSRTFPGKIYSSAPSINSSGSIAGGYYSYDGSQWGIYRYDSNGTIVDLGNLGLSKITASAINDRGDIAGSYMNGYDASTAYELHRPFRLSANGELTLIPTLGGTYIRNVLLNSSGDVSGSSTLPSAPTGVFDTHAFIFKDGVTRDIDLFNSRMTVANGMNNPGDVVGSFEAANFASWQSVVGNAFLYHDGAMYDLNWLLDGSGDGWLLYSANSINDNGWIVGQGWRHGEHLEPFLAIPNAGKPAGVQTRFVNVSTRLRTGAGDDVLIGGFILRGGAKRIIIRALGPGLANLGNPSATLPNLLADPTLELFDDRGQRIAFNDNFTDLPYFPDRNEILGYGLEPPYGGNITRDSVIVATLTEGSYTAVVRGKDGLSGNCLVEVYNVDIDYTPGLLNISTRGPVGVGDDVMIAGFIVRGDRERRILIRGIGPSLAGAGVPNPLMDPALEIHDQNGQIAENDGWRSDQETEILASGLSPKDDREASVILSLWPGDYTAIVRGKDNATGNASVEVYELPE